MSTRTAAKQALAEPVQEQAEPDAYGYASRLAVAIWQKHYKDTAPNWKPLNNLMSVLTQIKNMTAGLTCHEEDPVQEPVAWVRVIDEAMVAHHLGVADQADDYETAKRKMNELLCIAQDIGAYFAKTEQAEPVYWEVRCTAHPKWMRVDEQQFDEYVAHGWEGQKLYTAPPQRKPLPLKEVEKLIYEHTKINPNVADDREFLGYIVNAVRAIELAHGIGDPDRCPRCGKAGIHTCTPK